MKMECLMIVNVVIDSQQTTYDFDESVSSDYFLFLILENT